MARHSKALARTFAETPETVCEFCTDTFYVPADPIEFQTVAVNIEPTG